MRRLAAIALLGAAACVPGPTYEDIYPIIDGRCNGCHVDGISPLRPYFRDYESVAAMQYLIRDAVSFREMPPFGIDNTTSCGGSYFADEGLYLGDDEIQTIAQWVDDGAPAGDLDALRPGTRYVEPELRSIGATLEPGDYAFDGFAPATLHRCFVVDPGLADDSLLTAFQVVPGNPAAVSGAALYALDDPQAWTAAEALDADDDGPGYHCFGGSRVAGDRFLGSWVWGRSVVRLPEGTGLPLGADTRIVVQLSYEAAGVGLGGATDATRIDLELDPDARAATFVALSAAPFALLPGVEAAAASGFLEVSEGFELLGVAPLMHELGHDLEVDRVRPFSETCLARVPFWQQHGHRRVFQYLTTPPQVLPGDRLSIRCGYKTLARREPVLQGDGETDEQCLAYLYAVPLP